MKIGIYESFFKTKATWADDAAVLKAAKVTYYGGQGIKRQWIGATSDQDMTDFFALLADNGISAGLHVASAVSDWDTTPATLTGQFQASDLYLGHEVCEWTRDQRLSVLATARAAVPSIPARMFYGDVTLNLFSLPAQLASVIAAAEADIVHIVVTGGLNTSSGTTNMRRAIFTALDGQLSLLRRVGNTSQTWCHIDVNLGTPYSYLKSALRYIASFGFGVCLVRVLDESGLKVRADQIILDAIRDV